jgi:hypothetical protein
VHHRWVAYRGYRIGIAMREVIAAPRQAVSGKCCARLLQNFEPELVAAMESFRTLSGDVRLGRLRPGDPEVRWMLPGRGVSRRLARRRRGRRIDLRDRARSPRSRASTWPPPALRRSADAALSKPLRGRALFLMPGKRDASLPKLVRFGAPRANFTHLIQTRAYAHHRMIG